MFENQDIKKAEVAHYHLLGLLLSIEIDEGSSWEASPNFVKNTRFDVPEDVSLLSNFHENLSSGINLKYLFAW
jgi:hypothetical protein